MTNLQIAKLYLAANAGTDATALDAAITDGSALTAVTALTQTALLNAAYQAAFGRDADAEGLAYWGDRLDNGLTTTGLVDQLVAGAAAYVAPTADAPRTINGVEFTAAPAERANDVTISTAKATAEAASDATSYGAAAVAIVTVVDTATAAAAVVTIDAAEAAAAAAALAPFSLTTSVTDTLTGTTAGETLYGVNSSLLTEGTLQATDIIDGGTGADTMAISMKQAFTGFSTGSMKAVETISLTNATAGALNFDASGVSDATKYVIDSTAGLITVNDVSSLVDVEVSGPSSASTFTFDYATVSTVSTGTQTDTQNITLTNAGTIDSSAAGVATNATAMQLDIDDVETMAITTVGTANTIDLSTADSVATVTISGAGQTEVQSLSAATTSFDASAATGNVIATTTAAATGALTSVKTGSGDDTVTVTATDLTSNATLSGSTGTDILAFATTGAKTLQGTITGFETFDFTTPTGLLLLSGSSTTDLETVNLNVMTGGNSVQLANMGTGALTVNALGASTATNDFIADNSGAITLNLNVAATDTAQIANVSSYTLDSASSVVINVGDLVAYDAGNTDLISAAAATTVTLNVASEVVAGTENTLIGAGVTAASATSFDINAEGQLAGVIFTADKATTGTVTTGTSADDTLDIQGAKLTTLTIDANKGLDLSTSDLSAVQTFTADTEAFLDLVGEDMVDAANVTVSGTNDLSQATFKILGATTQSHVVNLTATGLKAGLTTAAVDAGTSSSTINVSGVTGAVTMTTIDADSGITFNAANTVGAISLGASALTTDGGDITVDVSAISSTATMGALNALGGTATTIGDVTLLATSAVGQVDVDVITGDNVTVNGQNALAAVIVNDGNDGGQIMDITAKTSVTYTGTNLTANGVDIVTEAESTAFTGTFNGGAKAEVLTVLGNTKQTSITVTGDLGAGNNTVGVTLVDNTASVASTDAQTVNLSGLTGSDKATTTTSTNIGADADSAITYTGSAMNDTIVINTANASTSVISITDTNLLDADRVLLDADTTAVTITLSNLSLSGIETLDIDMDAANNVTINASAISTQTIDVVGNTANDDLYLTGTADANVIDLGSVTSSTAIDLFITGSAGNDTVALTAAGVSIETLSFVDANGKDTISAFKVGEDLLDFSGITGISGAGAENAVAAGATVAVGTAVDDNIVVFADGATASGGETVADYTDLTDVAAFIEAGITGDNSALDHVVLINDLTTTKAYAYYINATTSADATVDATDLVLIGVIDADVAVTVTETI